MNKLLNKLLPPDLYETQKHNILAMVFVFIIIIVAQYPDYFKQSFNSVLGKFIVLMIIVMLTNYNVIAGLSACIVMIAIYLDLFKPGNEGFVGGVCPDPNNPDCPKPDTTDNKNSTQSTPANVGETTLVTDKFAAAPVTPVVPVTPVTPVAPVVPVAPVTPSVNMVDKMLNAQQQVASTSSKAIPVTLGKSENVEAFSNNNNGPTRLSPSFIKQR